MALQGLKEIVQPLLDACNDEPTMQRYAQKEAYDPETILSVLDSVKIKTYGPAGPGGVRSQNWSKSGLKPEFIKLALETAKKTRDLETQTGRTIYGSKDLAAGEMMNTFASLIAEENSEAQDEALAWEFQYINRQHPGHEEEIFPVIKDVVDRVARRPRLEHFAKELTGQAKVVFDQELQVRKPKAAKVI